MLRLILRVTVATAAAVWAFGCSSKGDGGSKSGGGGVGAACSDTSECTGYSKPTCVTEMRPLEGSVYADAGANGDVFRNFTVDFPGGYCTNTIQDSCAADADCGTGAGCFLAFEGVPPDTLDNLTALGLPFDVKEFGKAGVCLSTCTKDADCRTAEGYKCIVPLHAFLDVVNPDYKKTFCMQDQDVSALLQ